MKTVETDREYNKQVTYLYIIRRKKTKSLWGSFIIEASFCTRYGTWAINPLTKKIFLIKKNVSTRPNRKMIKKL